MTKSQFVPVLLCALLTSAHAQQPKPSANPFGGPPQATQAQQENFPPQLIEELNSIKTAALVDDYAYQQVAHLTENIGPRPSGSSAGARPPWITSPPSCGNSGSMSNSRK